MKASLALAVTSLVGLLAAGPTFAAAQTYHVNVNTPLTGTVPNPANQETVNLNGQLHLVGQATINDHHTHLVLNANGSDVKGVGNTTGVQYVGQGNLHLELNTDIPQGGQQAEGTAIVYLRLLGQGKTPDFRLRLQLHLTVNANGQVTATVVKYDSSLDQ